MPLNRIPNEDALRISQWGTQVFRDTAVAPTFKMYGNFQVTEAQSIADSPEWSGTYFQDVEPVYGPWQFGGTYAQNLTFEDLAILLRYGVKGGVAGASDGNSTPGYLYAYKPTGASDDLDVASVEHSVPGLPELAEMVLFNDFTISADADDTEAVWKWASRLWMRKNALIAGTAVTATGGSATTLVKTAAGWTSNQFQGAYLAVKTGSNAGQVVKIASNDATTLTLANTLPNAIASGDTAQISGQFTAGITDRTRERIVGPGTHVYIDDYPGGTIGTTEQLKWISWSITHNNNLSAKRFGSDVDYVSDKLGRGAIKVTGQIRIEFDSREEVDKWKAKSKRRMRIEQTGSQINASPLTKKRARIDVFNLSWSDVTRDTRGTNLTRTFAFIGYLDGTAASSVEYSSLVTLATLP